METGAGSGTPRSSPRGEGEVVVVVGGETSASFSWRASASLETDASMSIPDKTPREVSPIGCFLVYSHLFSFNSNRLQFTLSTTTH